MEAAQAAAGGGGRVDGEGNVFYGPIGIAMTRSLGNAVMGPAGIISDPLLTSCGLDNFFVEGRDKTGSTGEWWFVVLATDGVTDVLGHDELVGLVGENLSGPHIGDPDGAAKAVAEVARLRWLAGLPMEVKVDDITLVIFGNLPTD